MQLVLTGWQIAELGALWLLTVLVGCVLGFAQHWDWGDLEPPPRPSLLLQDPPTGEMRCVPMDMLTDAMDIVQQEYEWAWAGDPVLGPRLLELEIDQMSAQAERKIGRLAS